MNSPTLTFNPVLRRGAAETVRVVGGGFPMNPSMRVGLRRTAIGWKMADVIGPIKRTIRMTPPSAYHIFVEADACACDDLPCSK